MKANQKEIEAVSALPGPKRYEHFIKVVADREEVWGLYNEGWALAATNESNQAVMPVWPKREYAEHCSNADWHGFKPKSICLYEFIDEMIPGLNKEGIAICVFYLPTDKGIIPTIDQLLADLDRELEKY